MSNADLQKLIAEYSLDYCHFLEAVYGEGMMSEGGAAAIELMFESVSIKNKTVLDIGSGLGGVAIYLAKKFDLSVVGIDINSTMIAEAKQRIPKNLSDKISFHVYNDIAKLPFPDRHFDVVYSKGVLTHVQDKLPLFREVARIIKPNGKFIIIDLKNNSNLSFL
jgi:ubiquinone/menaquinone biosynthesis C-methylase UbiE